MAAAELHKKSYCRPVGQRRLTGLREKGQEVCVFTLICQPHGEESRRIKIPAWFYCPRTLLHLMRTLMGQESKSSPGPSPSAMSVIELEVHCLGIRSSEVKSFCLLHL